MRFVAAGGRSRDAGQVGFVAAACCKVVLAPHVLHLARGPGSISSLGRILGRDRQRDLCVSSNAVAYGFV